MTATEKITADLQDRCRRAASMSVVQCNLPQCRTVYQRRGWSIPTICPACGSTCRLLGPVRVEEVDHLPVIAAE